MTTIDAQGNLHDGTGKFAEKAHSAPSAALAAPTYFRSDPTFATIRLERWNSRDEAETIDVVDADVSQMLDGYSVAEIEQASKHDLDWIFEGQRAFGVGTDHDGPFTVEFDELDDGGTVLDRYLAKRRENGYHEASPEAREARERRRERADAEHAVSETATEAGLGVMAPVLTVVMDREEVGFGTFRRLNTEDMTHLYDILCTRGLDAVETELRYIEGRSDQ